MKKIASFGAPGRHGCQSLAGWLPVLMMLVTGLTGCATLSREECLTPDWHSIGYQDGLQGRVAQRITDDRKACARYGLAAGSVRYNEGWTAGVDHYCEPRSGFALGLNGEPYHGVCPVDREVEFLRAYNTGKEIHDTEQQLRRLGKILDVNRSQLQTLLVSVRQKEAELLSGNTGAQQRAVLLADIRDLQETVKMVNTEISGIKAAIEEENRRLLELRAVARHR